MSRFVISGKYKDGRLRVLDTYDGTVEPALVEEVKVLQAQGYSVSINKDYDFIYGLYNCNYRVDYIAYFRNMNNIGGFYVPYDNGEYKHAHLFIKYARVVINCFYKKDKIVLFSIRRDGDTYKLHYKSDVSAVLSDDFIVFMEYTVLVEEIDDYYSINYYNSNGLVSAIFDYDCNYIRSDK